MLRKGKQRIIQIKPMESKEKTKILEYSLPLRMTPWVEKGDLISRGQQLAEGHIDLKDLFRVAGQEVVQRYILREVQQIYTFAGENINDKHIEMIIRQMLSRLKVKSSGSTTLLADDIVERSRFERENQEAVKKKKQPALGQQILLGITKVSLSTESFLSAASFIETTRVLINASIQGKEDKLKGLKENVIIGKLIPAGTGLKP